MSERTAPLAHVQVVRGAPDDVELAALVAGLVAAVGQDHDPHGAEHPDAGTRSAWTDPARRHGGGPGRGTWRTGPDAWRWSLRG